MKKFTTIFVALAIILSLAGTLPAAAATDNSLLCSGYYGINRADGVIGQIAPGTKDAQLFSRVLADGELALSDSRNSPPPRIRPPMSAAMVLLPSPIFFR